MQLPPPLTETQICEIVQQICAGSPPPYPDTPERRDDCYEYSLGAFLSLFPADLDQAMVAAEFVRLSGHIFACLRVASWPGQDPQTRRNYRDRATHYMGVVQGALADLHKRQLTRADVAAGLPAPAKQKPAATHAERMRALDLRVIEAPHTTH